MIRNYFSAYFINQAWFTPGESKNISGVNFFIFLWHPSEHQRAWWLFYALPHTTYSFPLQYLLLCQLLPESLAVPDWHSLNFLLPLLRFFEPADEPLVTFAVGVHVAPQEAELPLPQVHLCKHSLPPLQEASDQLTVMLQISIALAVNPRHFVIHSRRPPKLVLQAVEYHLVGLCFGTHGLHTENSKITTKMKQSDTETNLENAETSWYLQLTALILHFLLITRNFTDVAQTSLVTLQRVFCIFSVSDHDIDRLQPENKMFAL